MCIDRVLPNTFKFLHKEGFFGRTLWIDFEQCNDQLKFYPINPSLTQPIGI